MGLPAVTFLVALTLSFTILMLATRPAARASKFIQQRLVTIQQPMRAERPGQAAELEKAERRDYAVRLGGYLRQYRFSKKLEMLLVQAGSSMTVGSVVLACAGEALLAALLAFVALHLAILAVAALPVGAVIPYFVLRAKRSRRLKAFNEALPDAIDLLARALRAGHSTNSAMELIAEQSPDPLGGEFVQVFQQQKFGIRFRDALLQMGDRVPSRDLHFLITAILVQKETGGDLTEILDRTAHVIRDRVRIEGEVRTHSAQGRLTGWILGLMPLAMLLLLNIVSPGYSSVLFHDPTGQKLLAAGGVLIAIGGLVIRKVVDVQP